MPLGSLHGWGVCGKNLTLEMSQLKGIRFITEGLESEAKNGSSHYNKLRELYVPLENLDVSLNPVGIYSFGQPVLQAIEGFNLRPWFIEAHSPKIIGYTFFEKRKLKNEDVSAARDYFDWIVAGSSWCEKILRDHNISNCSTIIQGIDTDLFHPGCMQKEKYKDQFVIFSGGKLEFRKGQDLVIRAFKILQDKYDDVLLVNAWYNLWDESLMTMQISPYITFDMPEGDYFKAVNHLMVANGIDPSKVVTLPPKVHAQMPGVYQDTDCGLFPNRCEGGTNLVLMEYMACGKPAIASLTSGHRDILTEDNCVPVSSMTDFTVQNTEERIIAQYDEPNLDEIIAKLEWAYHNRDSLKGIGKTAGEFMRTITWRKASEQFFELLYN